MDLSKRWPVRLNTSTHLSLSLSIYLYLSSINIPSHLVLTFRLLVDAQCCLILSHINILWYTHTPTHTTTNVAPCCQYSPCTVCTHSEQKADRYPPAYAAHPEASSMTAAVMTNDNANWSIGRADDKVALFSLGEVVTVSDVVVVAPMSKVLQKKIIWMKEKSKTSDKRSKFSNALWDFCWILYRNYIKLSQISSTYKPYWYAEDTRREPGCKSRQPPPAASDRAVRPCEFM